MTIYYSLTFALLVLEMVTFSILVLPLPLRWRHAMIKAFTTSPVIAKALHTLKIIFAFIFLLFIGMVMMGYFGMGMRMLTQEVDTFNRLQRIAEEVEEEAGHHHDYSIEASIRAKQFYAQRNLYLLGFTMFLSLILERTTALLIDMLQRDEQLQHMKKESATAVKDQERLVEIDASYQKQIQELKDQIAELKKQGPDFEALKKKAEQQATEYDSLLKDRDTFKQK